MSTFNYFSLYRESKQAEKRIGAKHILIWGLLAVMLCSVVYAFFFFQVLMRRHQLAVISEIKMNESFNQQYSAAVQASDHVFAAELTEHFLGLLILYAETIDTGNDRLFGTIDRCTAGEGEVSRISVSGNQVTVEGYVADMDRLTKVERNFRSTGAFSSILMTTVGKTQSNDMLQFSCQMTLDGGAILNEGQ